VAARAGQHSCLWAVVRTPPAARYGGGIGRCRHCRGRNKTLVTVGAQVTVARVEHATKHQIDGGIGSEPEVSVCVRRMAGKAVNY